MRQTLSDYDEGLHLVGEDRADEYARPDRRLPKIFLSMLAMALFAGGLWFAYVQGTRHPAPGIPGSVQGVQGGVQGDGVPLIRADERPTKVKPDQPGGMAIPDQNVSLYNDKPGGAPVEKLLPAAEQPVPRPAPAPREATLPPPPPIPAAPQSVPSLSPPAASPAPPQPAHTARPAVKAATAPPAKAAPQPKQAAVQPVAVHPVAAQPAAPASGKPGPIQLRLGSLRSSEAARDEWARLKRENPDLLGKLTAVAVRTDLGEQGIYYRIQAGSFGDAAAAEKLCGELKRRKLGCVLAR